MDQNSLPTGDLDEVQQEDDYAPLIKVPVCVEGVVPVQITGSRHATSNSRGLLLGETVQILNANPRRRTATLICDQSFYVDVQQAGAAAGVCALWPANVPLILTHQEEVWVRPSVAGVMSTLTEDWAD